VHAGDRHRVEKKKGVRVGGLVGLQDGQRLRVGELAVDVIHTPGHSSGECCCLLAGTPPVLFTGDTLFIRDCGRTDLETGSNEEMFASLQKIKRLPSDAIILPGHHYKPEYASVLSRELRESPPLLCRSVQELIELP
jgi:glyoxylase-like metal-dependent hydrolase (beta-lactamase superfamily II)